MNQVILKSKPIFNKVFVVLLVFIFLFLNTSYGYIAHVQTLPSEASLETTEHSEQDGDAQDREEDEEQGEEQEVSEPNQESLETTEQSEQDVDAQDREEDEEQGEEKEVSEPNQESLDTAEESVQDGDAQEDGEVEGQEEEQEISGDLEVVVPEPTTLETGRQFGLRNTISITSDITTVSEGVDTHITLTISTANTVENERTSLELTYTGATEYFTIPDDLPIFDVGSKVTTYTINLIPDNNEPGYGGEFVISIAPSEAYSISSSSGSVTIFVIDDDDDADLDNDRLIEIDTFEKLLNINNNLAGTLYKELPGSEGAGGCPLASCIGYELTADIEIPSSHSWESIGGAAPFTGIFNGNGYRISGISGTNALFSRISTGAIVRNLFLQVDLDGTSGMLSAVADSNEGVIENVVVEGTFDGTNFGGIVKLNAGIIQNVLAIVTSNSASSTEKSGGIAINNAGTGTIKNVYVGGIILGNSIGAIAGSNTGSIINSYATAELKAITGKLKDATKGLAAVSNGTIRKSYLDENTSKYKASGEVKKKSRELKNPVKKHKDIYSEWDAVVWDFGGRSDYPVLKIPVSYNGCVISDSTTTCKQAQPSPVPSFIYVPPVPIAETRGENFGARVIFIKAHGNGYDIRAQRGRNKEQKKNIIDFDRNKKIAAAKPILHINARTSEGQTVPATVSTKLISTSTCDASAFDASTTSLGASVAVNDSAISNGSRKEGYIPIGRELGMEDNGMYLCVKLEKTGIETEYIISQQIRNLRSPIDIQNLTPIIDSVRVYSKNNPTSFAHDVSTRKVPNFSISYRTEQVDSTDNVGAEGIIRFFENVGSLNSCPFTTTPTTISDATRPDLDSSFVATGEIHKNFLRDQKTGLLSPSKITTVDEYSCFVTFTNEFGYSAGKVVDFSVGEAAAALTQVPGFIDLIQDSIATSGPSGNSLGAFSYTVSITPHLQQLFEQQQKPVHIGTFFVALANLPEHSCPPITGEISINRPWKYIDLRSILYPFYTETSAIRITIPNVNTPYYFTPGEKYCLATRFIQEEGDIIYTDIKQIIYPVTPPAPVVPQLLQAEQRIGSIESGAVVATSDDFQYLYLGDELFVDLFFDQEVLLGNNGVYINDRRATLITQSYQRVHRVHVQIDETFSEESFLSIELANFSNRAGVFNAQGFSPSPRRTITNSFWIVDPRRPSLPNDLLISENSFERASGTVNEYDFKFSLSDPVRDVFSTANNPLVINSYVTKKLNNFCPPFLMELEGFPGWEESLALAFSYEYNSGVTEYPLKIKLASDDQFDAGNVYCVGVYGELENGAIMLTQTGEFVANSTNGTKPRLIEVENYKIKKAGETEFVTAESYEKLKHNDEILITAVFSENVSNGGNFLLENITDFPLRHVGYVDDPDDPNDLHEINSITYSRKHVYSAKLLNPALALPSSVGVLNVPDRYAVLEGFVFSSESGFTTGDGRASDSNQYSSDYWSVDHETPTLYSPRLQDIVVESDSGTEVRKLFTFISSELFTIRDTELGSCFTEIRPPGAIIDDIKTTGPTALFGYNAISIPSSQQFCNVILTDLAGNTSLANLFNFVNSISVNASSLKNPISSDRTFTFGLGASIKDYILNTQSTFSIESFYRVKTTLTCPPLFTLTSSQGNSVPGLGWGWTPTLAANEFTYDATRDLTNVSANFVENTTLSLHSNTNYCFGIAFKSDQLHGIPIAVTDFLYTPTTPESNLTFIFKHADGTSVNFSEKGSAVTANIVFASIPTDNQFVVKATKIDNAIACDAPSFSSVTDSITGFSNGVEKEIFETLTEVDNGKKICLEIVQSQGSEIVSTTYQSSERIDNIINSNLELLEFSGFSKNEEVRALQGQVVVGDRLQFRLSFSGNVTQPIVLVNGTSASIESEDLNGSIYSSEYSGNVVIQRTTSGGLITLSILTNNEGGSEFSLEEVTRWNVTGTNPQFTEVTILTAEKNIVPVGTTLVPGTEYIAEISFDTFVSKPVVSVGGILVSPNLVVGKDGEGNEATPELFEKYQATFTVTRSDSAASPVVIGTKQGLLDVSAYSFRNTRGIIGARTSIFAEGIFVDYEIPRITDLEAEFDGPTKVLLDGGKLVEHKYAKSGTPITFKIYVKELSADLTQFPFDAFTVELTKNGDVDLTSTPASNPTIVVDNEVYLFEAQYIVPENSSTKDVGVEDILYIRGLNLRDNIDGNVSHIEISPILNNIIIDSVKPVISSASISSITPGIKPTFTFTTFEDATINFGSSDLCFVNGNKNHAVTHGSGVEIELDLITLPPGDSQLCTVTATDFAGNISDPVEVLVTVPLRAIDLALDASKLYPINNRLYNVDFQLSDEVDQEIRNNTNTIQITPILAIKSSSNFCSTNFTGEAGTALTIDSSALGSIEQQSNKTANYTIGIPSVSDFVVGTEYCVRLAVTFSTPVVTIPYVISNFVEFSHETVSIGTPVFGAPNSYTVPLSFSTNLESALRSGASSHQTSFDTIVDRYYKKKGTAVSCEIPSRDFAGNGWTSIPFGYGLSNISDTVPFVIEEATGGAIYCLALVYQFDDSPSETFEDESYAAILVHPYIAVSSLTAIELQPPQKPSIPRVSTTSTSEISVEWDSPISIELPITSYQIEFSTSENGVFASAGVLDDSDDDITTRTATIGGLTPNTTYYVRFSATNSEGTSDWSDISSIKTYGIITSPTLVGDLVINAQEKQGVVTFGGANADGVAISVTITAPDTSTIITNNLSATVAANTWSYELSGVLLTQDGIYTLETNTSKQGFVTDISTHLFTVDSISPVFTYTAPSSLRIGASVNISPATDGSTYSYATSSTLPSDLSFDLSTGVISGTITQLVATTTDIVITVTDEAGNSAEHTLTLPIIEGTSLDFTGNGVKNITDAQIFYFLVNGIRPSAIAFLVESSTGLSTPEKVDRLVALENAIATDPSLDFSGNGGPANSTDGLIIYLVAAHVSPAAIALLIEDSTGFSSEEKTDRIIALRERFRS